MNEQPWRTDDDFPDWEDAGLIELRLEDGTVVLGELEDTGDGFDGAYPTFKLTVDGDPREHLMTLDFPAWRPLVFEGPPRPPYKPGYSPSAFGFYHPSDPHVFIVRSKGQFVRPPT